MAKSHKDHFPRIDSETRKKFDERTNLGDNVAVEIIVNAENGYIRGLDSLILHTVGLHQRDLPELVILLGPRRGDNPIPEDDVMDLVNNALTIANLESITKLLTERPIIFHTKSPAPRRFMLVPMTDSGKNVMKYGKLASLTAYYNDCNFDFLLYEPSPWIH